MHLTFENGRLGTKLTVFGTKKKEIEMVVDTGASMTHIDEEICNDLSLPITGQHDVGCVHGDWKPLNVYVARVQMESYVKNEKLIIGMKNTGQTGKAKRGLLGRDILSSYKLSADWKSPKADLDII